MRDEAKTWVKICGNTNLDDAQMAAELGADAVGFVFAPSVRRMTASDVARITPHLPKELEKIGVFPAWSAEEIEAAAREAGLTGVQLHGGLDLGVLRQLTDRLAGEIDVIPVLSWRVDGDEDEAEKVQSGLQELGLESISRVLVDSRVGAATGGTGVHFDWGAAHGVFHDSSSKLILAGGLRPENVREAIQQLDPWGVDVSSGVEAAPGKKDRDKVASFLREAKA